MHTIETIITVRVLRFLVQVAHMNDSRLTRQVMSSQGVISKLDCQQGKRAGLGQQTATKNYIVTQSNAVNFLNMNDIENHEWFKKLTERDIDQTIESNLGLSCGAFKKLKHQTGDHFI